jgi:uridine phosphorylase
VTVEMETAAFLAVAQFRRVRFAQYHYAADDVSGETWAHRNWTSHDGRMDLLDRSIELVLQL